MKRSLESPTFLVFLAFVALTIVFSVSQAGERDHQSIDDIDNASKGIAIAIVDTCGIRSLYYGLKDKRWTLCGEPKPEPETIKPAPF